MVIEIVDLPTKNGVQQQTVSLPEAMSPSAMIFQALCV